jgi:phage terminase large subunit-like protein
MSDDDMERLAEIQRQLEHWDPKARAEAMKHLSAMDEVLVQAWYCTKGRKCDGDPHDEYTWQHARGSQWPPAGDEWFVWACLAGRGWGKTRTGAEYTRKMSEVVGRMALVAPTAQDARDTMIDGESGLIAVCANAGMKVLYEPSKKRVTFPNGSRATLFSGEEPDRLRGPQHGFAWLDEPAHMPQIEEIWENLRLGLRLPPRPHIIVTTTPKPIPWVRDLIAQPKTRWVRGKTYDNLKNLADNYEDIIADLEGTRRGRQELYGEILDDVEGALWISDWIRHNALKVKVEELERIVVAVDPAGTANRRSDKTGIVTIGKQGKMAHVLRDSSGTLAPADWARQVIRDYEAFQASAVVVEVNFGADMVKENLRHNGFEGRVIEARASRGKELRAEPVVSLYELGRVMHNEHFQSLEDEMLTWVPGVGASPNRVDALVWGVTELLKPGGSITLKSSRGIGAPGLFSGGPRRMNPIKKLELERRGR